MLPVTYLAIFIFIILEQHNSRQFFILIIFATSIFQDVFDQLWAAEDYEVFKQLMIQKNIQLQLQALQIIQQIHNVQMPMPTQMPMPGPVAAPPGAAPAPGAPPAPVVDEDAIMQEVLKRSKEEYESQKKDANRKKEQEMEKTLAESNEDSERLGINKSDSTQVQLVFFACSGWPI